MKDGGDWLVKFSNWAQQHPWRVGAIGGVFIGTLVGFLEMSRQGDPSGLFAGAWFGLLIFILTGVWGELLLRQARGRERQRRVGWKDSHPVLWSMGLAAFVGSVWVVIERARGRPWIDSLSLGAVVAFIVASLRVAQLLVAKRRK